jgi:hypothetical protein
MASEWPAGLAAGIPFSAQAKNPDRDAPGMVAGRIATLDCEGGACRVNTSRSHRRHGNARHVRVRRRARTGRAGGVPGRLEKCDL